MVAGSMVAGSMVAGNTTIMVPAGMAIAMGGRAVPAWNGSMMAGLGMERWTTGSGVVALQKRQMMLMQMRLMQRLDGSLVQHTEFGEPTTGCRLPLR